MIPVSGCVIARDEEDRIAACVESLGFCAEVVVLDSGSRDRTREVAAALGARVEIQDPFLGYAAQKQRCVELARHDWIVALDCDERVTPALAAELAGALAAEPDGVAGFTVRRRNRYLGRWMRFGDFGRERKLRVFDRRRARWGGTDPHDRVEVLSGRVLALAGAIEHDSYRSFAEHRRTVERFAALAADALAAAGRRASALDPWLRPAAAFLGCAVLRAGLLDGWRGLLAALMAARYDHLKYRRLRRLGSQ